MKLSTLDNIGLKIRNNIYFICNFIQLSSVMFVNFNQQQFKSIINRSTLMLLQRESYEGKQEKKHQLKLCVGRNKES